MTAALLAFLLVASPMTAGTVETDYDHGSSTGSCTSYSWKVPPSHIRVLRAHHRGSSVRKRIEVWDLDSYTAAVAASGAWPNAVWESIKVGAIAIGQYAVWMAIHTHRRWKGQCYDISDSEQYLRPGARPGGHLPTRTLHVVSLMRGVFLTKHGRHFRTGWSGGTCSDGWHLCEDSVRQLAQSGLGWRTIVRRLLWPVSIRGDWR